MRHVYASVDLGEDLISGLDPDGRVIAGVPTVDKAPFLIIRSQIEV
jgi:hypothetical protein